MTKTKIFAHRGSRGTHPENTLPAFAEALRVNSDGIELDVHLSKDGELIVIHDEAVDRTTNGKGFVKDLTLAEIKALDAGSWFHRDFAGEQIPTLSEVLTLLEGFHGTLNIEIKTDKIWYEAIEANLLDCVAQHQPSYDVVYSSFRVESIYKIQELQPTAKVGHLFKTRNKMREVEQHCQLDGLHPSIQWLRVRRFFGLPRKYPLRPWTVNKDRDIKLCLRKKVAVLMTDYPEKALKIRQEHSLE